MWVYVRTASNLITAEMWRELLENQGVPTLLHVEPDKRHLGIGAPHEVLVPKEKKFIAEDVLRETLLLT